MSDEAYLHGANTPAGRNIEKNWLRADDWRRARSRDSLAPLETV